MLDPGLSPGDPTSAFWELIFGAGRGQEENGRWHSQGKHSPVMNSVWGRGGCHSSRVRGGFPEEGRLVPRLRVSGNSAGSREGTQPGKGWGRGMGASRVLRRW